MNIDLIRRTVEHIEAHPEEFLMDSYFRDFSGGEWARRLRENYEKRNGRPLSCGTVGCIAGTALILSRGVDAVREIDGSVDRSFLVEATEVLEIEDLSHARNLFFGKEIEEDKGYSIAQIDEDPSLVRAHVEAVLGIKL